jgi:hypothetical protein
MSLNFGDGGRAKIGQRLFDFGTLEYQRLNGLVDRLIVTATMGRNRLPCDSAMPVNART